MPSDPQKFKREAVPGKMKHTFTALRRSFPNVAIHAVIGHAFLYRKELCKRTEFDSTTAWNDLLVNFCHNCLTKLGEEIDEITYRGGAIQRPLAERNKEMLAFIATATQKTTSIEALATSTDAQHADQVFGPVEFNQTTIPFDVTGEDADYPQPTPSRFRNTAGRQLIIGIDRWIVFLSRTQSADLQRMINQYEAAIAKSMLSELYALVSTRGGNDELPFIPTSIDRSQLDDVYNADGSLDPSLHDAVRPQQQSESSESLDLSGLR